VGDKQFAIPLALQLLINHPLVIPTKEGSLIKKIYEILLLYERDPDDRIVDE
jgi:hypothetical protein